MLHFHVIDISLVDSRAFYSLTTVGEDSRSLRDCLIRVALSYDSPSSAAVLKSLLAFASLHRYGFQSHAAQLKLSALSVLAASAKTGVDSHEVIPHLAAGMLLCCFEVRTEKKLPSLDHVRLTVTSRSTSRQKRQLSGCGTSPG